jgi:LmbE family N-acetylglucosaminyl deacetylase
MDILLVIGHPDDDAIFAGALQQRLAAHAWSVACLTATPDTPRGGELLRWQAELGTPRERLHFLGAVDAPEDYRSGRSSIAPEAVMKGLRALALAPELVVTHNAHGEYGHPHHALVHAAVAQVYPETPRLEFGYGCDASDWQLPCTEKWPNVVRCYASQQRVIEKFRVELETFCWSSATPPDARRNIARRLGWG